MKLLLLLLLSFSFTSNYQLSSESAGSTVLNFTNGQVNIDNLEGFSRILSANNSSTTEEGMPELPVYTSFFQMNPEKEYSISYEVVSSHTIDDINIYPFQGHDDERPLSKNIKIAQSIYDSESTYPNQNLSLSDPMVMRDIEVGMISFVPFQYNFGSKTLEVFDEVEITISEVGDRVSTSSIPSKRSLLFEPFYDQLVVNYEPLESRNDYQVSSILYICGGSSISHPYVVDLIEWRERQGYIVYAVSTSETGTSTNNISNYLEDAYDNWDNPPEIVGFIGDVGGSYNISTYNIEGGAGDNEYAYIEGNDFLPEIFVGRISANSSSDLSNIINKTLVYEQGTAQSAGWFERAALVGDPSSSGLSTITTSQYMENLFENHGMTDMRTNYNNGSYDSWVDDQFDDGILYYSYRGFYGSSGINPDNGWDSGSETPFAVTVTCGTGDFDGTSDSEDFVRVGSVNSPKGAVACVGVSTSATHTAYNNIVSMGIMAGPFSFNMHHAGAALAYGKISLYMTYPTNPYNCVTKFSQWPNLIGDPALHLWTDSPKDFEPEFNSSVPDGINYLSVLVKDEQGNIVPNARVSVRSSNVFESVYSDDSGEAMLVWQGDATGALKLSVHKNNFRLYENIVNVGAVQGPAVYLDQTRSMVDDNQEGQLNPGETIDLNLRLVNLGLEDADNVSVAIVSGSDKVYLANDSIVLSEISADGYADVEFELSLSDDAYESEDLDMKVYISDSESNSWSHNIPLHVYGPKLEMTYYNSNGVLLEKNVETEIDLHMVNSGSVNMSNVNIELLDNANLTFENNYFTISEIEETSDFVLSNLIIKPTSNVINGSQVSANYSYSSSEGYNGQGLITFDVGTREVGDPMGPDEYGYYIFDSEDTEYPIAPVYDWIEIGPGSGLGTSLGFEDAGNGCLTTGGWYGCNGFPDDIAVVSLGFDFDFYGVTYDEITVNSNGYISFVRNQMSSFRNYNIPGAGGPSPMVAAFWDDLKVGHNNSAKVYKYVTDEYVVIQWYEVETYQNDSDNNFQIIIYNPEYQSHSTPTGDGEIKIQYREFNNTTQGDYSQYTPIHGCYATVGIENQFGNVGLEYTFDNEYPESNMVLYGESGGNPGAAILITTSPGSVSMPGDMNDDETLNVLDVVTLVNVILNVIEPTQGQLYAGDINSDGGINVLDVVLLVNMILNTGV